MSKISHSRFRLKEPRSNYRHKVIIHKEVRGENYPHITSLLHRYARHQVDLLNGILPTVGVIHIVEVIFLEHYILVYACN